MHCAWRVYGEPSVEVIGEFETSDQLHAAEIAAIKNHKTLSPFGYNLGAGGETAPSKNSEVAKKISAKAKGRNHSDASIATMSANSKQLWESQEYRTKVLNAVKASWTSERRLARSERSKAFWAKRKADGWEMPQSHKDNLSKRVFSDETKAKMSAAAKGKPKAPRTQETKAKLAKSIANSWDNPAIKEKRASAISSALLEKYSNMTEAEKQAFSDIRKRAWATRKAKQNQPS